LRFSDSEGTRTAYIAKGVGGNLVISVDSADDFNMYTRVAGQALRLRPKMTDGSTESLTSQEDPGTENKHQVDVSLGAAGAKFTIGSEVEIHGGVDGVETIFNQNSRDIDFRVEGENVDDVFKVDAGLDQILAGTTIAIKERAASQADTANYGQLWVKDDDPNILRYTDGDGTEFIVNMTAV
jgi:hypothetical protein